MPKPKDRDFVSYRAVRSANTALKERTAVSGTVIIRDASTGMFMMSKKVSEPRDAQRVKHSSIVQYSKVSTKR